MRGVFGCDSGSFGRGVISHFTGKTFLTFQGAGVNGEVE